MIIILIVDRPLQVKIFLSVHFPLNRIAENDQIMVVVWLDFC
jgi:hypothetical protein